MKQKKYTIPSLIFNNVTNPVFFTLMYVFSAIGYTLQIVTIIFFGDLTNAMAKEGFAIEDAFMPLTLVLGTNIVMHIFWRTSGWFESRCIPTFMHNNRMMVTADILSRKIDIFTNELAGSISSRGGQLNMALKSITHSFQWILMGVMIEIVVVTYYAFSLDLLIGSLGFLWIVFSFLFSFYYIKKGMYKNMEEIASRTAITSGHRTDLISNVALVLTANWFKKGYESFDIISKDLRNSWQRNIILANWFFSFLVLMELIFLSSIIYYSATLVESQSLNIGQFIAITYLMFRISYTIWDGCLEMNDFLKNVATARESIDFFEKYDIDDLDSGEKLTLKNAPSLEFKDVSFKYNSSADTLFENFNLNIKTGERIGLVGHSGSGKTSLVNLALSFYEPESGQLFMNGKAISDYTKNSYRQHISVISQESSMFHQSVKENIAYGIPNATDEDIINAAKQAYAHDFISKLENGYDSMVGDRGVQLSGGQRQRIAIARAILKNSPIFILDEATSALDSQSEKYIQDSLKEVMKNKTVIAIAHRLSTISEMDRIIVLDAGKIVEEGSHEALLKKGGSYAKMWAMQSGGFLQE